MATYAITGTILDLTGDPHAASPVGVRLWLKSSEDFIGIGASAHTGGMQPIAVAADGSVNHDGIPETVDGAPMYRLRVESTHLRAAGRESGVTSGWFALPAGGITLGEIAETYFAPTLVEPGMYASIVELVAAAQAAAEDAAGVAESVAEDRAYVEGIVITDLGTTDGQAAALIQTPSSDTAQAVAATIDAETARTNALRAGAIGDGVANDSSAFAAMTGVVVVPPGTYRIGSNATVTASLVVTPGAVFSVETGATPTVRGKIIDGAVDMFNDAGGSVNLVGSENEYNLGWFKSGAGYINQRWAFASRAMVTYTRKVIRVPAPQIGGAGVHVAGTRAFWGFNGPMVWTDSHNTATWHIEGEFFCVADCAGFLQVGSTAKPEDIEVLGTVMVNIPSTRNVPVGIDLTGVARLTFRGEVVINGAKLSIRIGSANQVAPVGSIRFFHVQCSFFTDCAVQVYGKIVHSTQDVQIDRLGATAAQVAGRPVVRIQGLIRDVRLGNVYYATDTAKDGYATHDADTVVLIESNNQGEVYKVEVDGIYQATASKGLVVRTDSGTPQGNDKIQGVSVQRIWAKYNGVAADIGNCAICYIGKLYGNGDFTIQSTASAIMAEVGPGVRTVTNNSTNSVINGLGTQSRGSGLPPAPAVAWPIGALIRETSDGKVYLRVAKTNAASDFIALN